MSTSDRIIKVLKENLNKKLAISAESRLVEDLAIDSFDKLMIIAGLEDEFNINIDVDDFSKYNTVNDIVNNFNELEPQSEG